jgi:chorismate mutase/prephenate dehydratase
MAEQPAPGELRALRLKMDEVNGELLRLFVARMELSAQMAEYKEHHGLPVRDAAREEAVLREMRAQCPPELWDDARRLFLLLIDASRDYQNRLLGKL